MGRAEGSAFNVLLTPVVHRTEGPERNILGGHRGSTLCMNRTYHRYIGQ